MKHPPEASRALNRALPWMKHGTLTTVIPRSVVQEVLHRTHRASQRRRLLPAWFLVYVLVASPRGRGGNHRRDAGAKCSKTRWPRFICGPFDTL